MTSFGREVKPCISCRRFTARKRTSSRNKSLWAKFVGLFTLDVGLVVKPNNNNNNNKLKCSKRLIYVITLPVSNVLHFVPPRWDEPFSRYSNLASSAIFNCYQTWPIFPNFPGATLFPSPIFPRFQFCSVANISPMQILLRRQFCPVAKLTQLLNFPVPVLRRFQEWSGVNLATFSILSRS